jgi:hypothetical protein
MRIMFDAISVTNETRYVPSSGGGAAACGGAIGGEDNSEVERDGHLSNSPDIQPNSRKRPAECSPKGKKKKSFRDTCMKSLVDAYEKKALSSNNSVTSMLVDSVREEIVKNKLLRMRLKKAAMNTTMQHNFLNRKKIVICLLLSRHQMGG